MAVVFLHNLLFIHHNSQTSSFEAKGELSIQDQPVTRTSREKLIFLIDFCSKVSHCQELQAVLREEIGRLSDEEPGF